MEKHLPNNGIVSIAEDLKYFRAKLTHTTDPVQIEGLVKKIKILEATFAVYTSSKANDTNYHYYF